MCTVGRPRWEGVEGSSLCSPVPPFLWSPGGLVPYLVPAGVGTEGAPLCRPGEVATELGPHPWQICWPFWVQRWSSWQPQIPSPPKSDGLSPLYSHVCLALMTLR